MWLMGCHCVMSSVCMGRWCSLRVQGLCVTLSRKIPHFATGVLSMFTSSKVGLTTPALENMQQPQLQFINIINFTLFSSHHCPMTIMSFYYPQVTVTRWYCSNRFISLLVGWSCTKLLAYVSHMATVHVM